MANEFKIKNVILKHGIFGILITLQYKNNHFEVRKFFVQTRPMRTQKEFKKLNTNILTNVELEYIDQIDNKVIIYLKTLDTKTTKIKVKNIILCNGTFGLLYLLFKSVNKGLLNKIKATNI